MVDQEKPEKIELDEVMLAMDVVDTLRHEQQLVERELTSDARDQALFEKVKRMYASQGLEVTDEIIAEGVAALREERFAYRTPPPRGTLWLARLYVNRRKWAKVLGGVAALLAAVFLLYRFAFVAPEVRQQARAVRDINTRISQQQDRITVARQRFSSLSQSLGSTQSKVSQSSEVAARRLLADASLQLEGADTKLQAFDKLPLKANLDAESLAREGDAIARRLDQREGLLRDADAHLDKVEAAVADLSGLAALREKLAGQRQSLMAESREDAANVQVEKLYADALAALNSGDVQGARKGSAALQELYGRLVQEYELRIVSRPGTLTAVWREPRNRPGVRNYYVIVDAVTPRGERVVLPITSEEDGTTRTVTQWGLRVDNALYEKIRRDKLDDGIIQNNRFGVKERGYLTPHYLMPTTGGAITQW
ncbi:DUF6384 family protein [Desulforhabdus sp. TSK]|uniref:DUF6384 family protein n=1 Tax=Desulforhabdus sp. TSK TaxID=2925014 RepID=UPI001FC8D66C|nr:DUF6384 family protein [Desulforhabdus sp. TSK]GKT10797.1 hypothetical protein DSTSK_41020 [Desulforhabdus sp. TSK]